MVFPETSRATLSALWACQIALVVARYSFCYSKRSCAEILARRSFIESLRRDLATETSCKDLVQRPLTEILYGDLAQRSHRELEQGCYFEISYRELL